MSRSLSPDWYRIEIQKVMVSGEPLYEGRIAELSGVVVYGTTVEAVRTDVHYQLGKLRIAARESENPSLVSSHVAIKQGDGQAAQHYATSGKRR